MRTTLLRIVPLAILALACQSPNALASPDTPPSVVASPGGVIRVELGDSAEFEVCGRSFVGGDIEIEPIDSPEWCRRSRGHRSEGCVAYIITPTTIGAHTLRFMVIDDENDTATEHAVTVEVSDRGGCNDLPICTATPPGPLMIDAGQSVMLEICGESPCGNTVQLHTPAGLPDWAVAQDPFGDDQCATYLLTPPNSAGGMHTLHFQITDDVNAQSGFCNVMVEVIGCDDLPICTATPPGPLKVNAGGSIMLEICGESQCGNPVQLYTPAGLPDWVVAQDTFGDDQCTTYLLSPPENAAGMYDLHYQITDDVNAQSGFCNIMVEVNPPCADPPRCFSRSIPPTMAYVGEEFSFDVCGESLCGNEAGITALNLPDWCSESDLRIDETCIVVTCTPPNNVEGLHSFEFEIEDLGNGLKTTCSVGIEVVCHLEPFCSFSEAGPISVAVGEEIDLEFCGVTACNGHRARIEMSSRPPFITPAGHQKGGVDQEICLPIKGTPRPGDEGSWRVKVMVRDLDTGVETECDIQIIVTGASCVQPPTCSVEPGEFIGAAPGAEVALTVCAEPGCPDGVITLEAIELPGFCDEIPRAVGGMGEAVCAPILCTVPNDTAPGEYPVRFLATDTTSGLTTECTATIVVGNQVRGCFEQEPNNMLTICTTLDADGCLNLNDCGSFVDGYLGESGDDRDYYCITGLEPGAIYNALIVGGIGSGGEPTCAALACLDESGMVIEVTNTGPMGMGRPSLPCLADDSGRIHVAISGCSDLDLDGQDDNPPVGAIGGIGHGSRGSYQLLVSPIEVFDNASLACHADMNGNGIVDTADLGMLIGIFGERCDP
jgi:hypothetical protein